MYGLICPVSELAGLVVQTSASSAGDPGFKSRSSHSGDFKISYSTLPDAGVMTRSKRGLVCPVSERYDRARQQV